MRIKTGRYGVRTAVNSASQKAHNITGSMNTAAEPE